MTAVSDFRRGLFEAPPSRASHAGEGVGRFVVGSIVGVVLVRGSYLPDRDPLALAIAAIEMVAPLVVLVARRSERPTLAAKVVALGIAMAAASLGVVLGFRPSFAVGGIVASLIAIQTADRDLWIRLAALAATYASLLGVPLLVAQDATYFTDGRDDWATVTGDVVRLSVTLALLVLLNHIIRREEAERERQAAAVAQERARIARELHDVIAHQVTLGLVQAEVARATLPEGADASALALDRVTESSRKAMTELRSLLGVLRDPQTGQDRAPQPGVDDIAALVAGSRPAGLDVTLDVDPAAADLPEGVQASIYRIVQEALTNVVRHVGPSSVGVAVRCGDGVQVSVVDAGPTNGSRPAQSAGGGGHGIAGMRERVTSLGGELQTGPEGAGFAVRASLPTQ